MVIFSRDRTDWRCVLGGALLLTVTFLTYSPAIDGGYVWDDDEYVTENPTLRTLEGLEAIWLKPRSTPQYYPLVHTTFWIEYRLWGLDARGYHTTNVVLHALAAFLLWRLLLRLGAVGAYCAAVVFALHPVHVESVAWITERKNVLSCVFYLAAAIAYWRFDMAGRGQHAIEHAAPPGEERGWYGAAAVLFLAALLSKTVTATWPAAMLVLLWWRYGRITRNDVVRLLPFFAVGVAAGLFTAWVEVNHVRAEGTPWDSSLWQRFGLAGRTIWFYLFKLIWPSGLCFIYPRWNLDRWSWSSCAAPIAVIAVLSACWALRARVGRGPLAACLLFIGMLFPALGFFNVYPMRFSYVADHFQYHASLAMITLLVSGLAVGLRRVGVGRPSGGGHDRRRVSMPWPVCLVIGGVLSVAARRQAAVYRSPETLWRATLASNPRAWIASTNLGLTLLDEGRLTEASAWVREAREIDPDNVDIRLANGFVCLRRGDLATAYAELSHVVKQRPDSVRGHALLGAVEARRGNIEPAIRHYQEALRLQPSALQPRAELAFLLENEGYVRPAIEAYETLLGYNPSSVEAMVSLVRLYRRIGEETEADRWAGRVVTLRPDLRSTVALPGR